MNTLQAIEAKIKDREQAKTAVAGWQSQGERVVFTNGCFDLLHYGHLHYLASARDLGERLVVGINAAASVRRLKGPNRPINDERTRQAMLASLAFVDIVVSFEEDTPLALIQSLLPDVLVKGGDWLPEAIVGARIVREHGGIVRSLPYIKGYSTSAIEQKIRSW